ncbi:MAG: glycerol-3-phosphate 1-O-acyltransferase PlsY [Nereida ignava]|uniref:glycerol-3-phosphate 1-O-acyltransferase PlsY n=1 Tax=Nereida ignava TaxID=282199 RepID=UPI0030F5C4B5
MTIITLFLAALAGYLFGAIPFGIVMAKVFGLGDLRAIGSGNIGATNVLRTGNKLAAFLTLILDAGKAGIAVLLAGALFGELAGLVAGLAAFVGHCYPVWLGFKGGKGVATFFGLIFAACWPVGVAAGATWLVVAALSRYSSLSALIASALAPVYAAALGGTLMVPFLIVLALLIFWRHTENIQRLLKGTEGKIGSK